MDKIRVMVFSLIIIWASIGIAMVIGNIYTGPEQYINSQPSNFNLNSSYPSIPVSTGMDILKIMEFTVFFWIGLFIVSLILYFKSTIKIIYKAIMAFLGILILVGIVYLISIFIHLSTSTSSSLGSLSFSTENTAGSLPIIAGIILLSFLVLFILFKNFTLPVKSEKDNIETNISKMIRELQFSNDVRGSILKTYYELSNILKKHGIIEAEYLTPREFENMSLEKYHMDKEPFETIISLFEEARYSVHDLTEIHRNRAIEALEKIRTMVGEGK